MTNYDKLFHGMLFNPCRKIVIFHDYSASCNFLDWLSSATNIISQCHSKMKTDPKIKTNLAYFSDLNLMLTPILVLIVEKEFLFDSISMKHTVINWLRYVKFMPRLSLAEEFFTTAPATLPRYPIPAIPASRVIYFCGGGFCGGGVK